ncbi:hypothetical protein ADUPG1_007243 [Aduncisulcus paluster]|uniref:Protein kinase domain-containing protein n=1 Tax=Aduncisulcus paluster TaxID=2918883 RepID=A0ABQ5KLA3_9EUKA|nr:hypothetical protein ADUPG1_007243 [Aduncisulcus paluster]
MYSTVEQDYLKRRKAHLLHQNEEEKKRFLSNPLPFCHDSIKHKRADGDLEESSESGESEEEGDSHGRYTGREEEKDCNTKEFESGSKDYYYAQMEKYNITEDDAFIGRIGKECTHVIAENMNGLREARDLFTKLETNGKGRKTERKSREIILVSVKWIFECAWLWKRKVTQPFELKKTTTSTLSLPSKPVKEIVIKGNDKDPTPKDTKQKKHKDKRNITPRISSRSLTKHDSLTLTSASTLTSQCIIGSDGFGEVLLVLIDGIPFPCVLKKMLRIADKTVVKGCRKEFKVQLKLFTNPKCFNRIPRPLYALDFARSWCSQGKYACYVRESTMGGTESDSTAVIHDHGDGNDGDEDDSDDREEELHSDSESYGSDGSDKNSDHSESSSSSSSRQSMRSVDLTLLDPLRICALCAEIIQCVSDILKEKSDLIHRNIKLNNFLIRVDSTSMACTVVLDGIGFSHIRDMIIHSKQLSRQERRKFVSSLSDQFIFESLVFKSPESFDGIETQKSDAYSLGLTLFSLFFGCTPFTQMQAYEGLDSVEAFYKRLIEQQCKLSLSDSCVFRKLKTMEEGKYKHLHTCFEEIIYGLIRFNPAERMSVHEACERLSSSTDPLNNLDSHRHALI